MIFIDADKGGYEAYHEACLSYPYPYPYLHPYP